MIGIAVIAALVFVIGAVCGGAVTRAGMLSKMKETEAQTDEMIKHRLALVAGVELIALRDLRNENYDQAIEWLEAALDSNLVGLSLFAEDLSEKRDLHMILLLKQIKAYRDQYPQKTDTPEFDDVAARVLNFVDQINVRVRGADGS